MSASCEPRIQLFADAGNGWPHSALQCSLSLADANQLSQWHFRQFTVLSLRIGSHSPVRFLLQLMPIDQCNWWQIKNQRTEISLYSHAKSLGVLSCCTCCKTVFYVVITNGFIRLYWALCAAFNANSPIYDSILRSKTKERTDRRIDKLAVAAIIIFFFHYVRLFASSLPQWPSLTKP